MRVVSGETTLILSRTILAFCGLSNIGSSASDSAHGFIGASIHCALALSP
jgi:hypothetical protein